jgi:hypothetical protein
VNISTNQGVIGGKGVHIGRKTGTGHIGSIKIPGFLVVKMRESLFVEMMDPIVSGTKF